ncbi:isopentenyl-diphosphate Delta-isomerase [Lishizhenia sp.]|uniref:isopentenyl-diphosphate Delta-isomerase n=1 Tax=Lishizhenia sp. TaxID=2497594 RepID=UPI00299F0079|nr:isopentenyl-diphosphate Delta-isomerase [Lishizhenia sp.]MDX1446292.1 isopentenyl-diphosphate Delta-isomerase [Lishizhenia sp.]
MSEQIILVDEENNFLGEMEKMEVHEKGLLHRAFSVMIFNDKREVLIHKRASDKYHCGGLWTNACCSHPRKDETIVEAGKRRLQEEMGFSLPELKEHHSFIYKAPFANGLTEHELDFLLTGRYNAAPLPNPEEVEDWKYINVQDLRKDIALHPDDYTPWFRIIMDEHLEKIMAGL